MLDEILVKLQGMRDVKVSDVCREGEGAPVQFECLFWISEVLVCEFLLSTSGSASAERYRLPHLRVHRAAPPKLARAQTCPT